MASSNNSASQSVVKKVESRVEQLIADHKRISELNRDLMKQRDNLQATKREMQERIATLEKELSLSELRGGLTVATKSRSRARLYVNRLMREVDYCIRLISSPGDTPQEEAEAEIEAGAGAGGENNYIQ
ncbi:MAG: hypothetical protein SNH55_03035 [Rikenellaceae bacterium]